MCGIAGFIGLSKKPKATNEIITNLFDFLEFRGTDASGIWAAEAGKEGKVFYHKEPIKSSEFIKKDFWKKIRKSKINLFLAHARATSKGNGHASTNSNNHPFVSLDRRIGMVHNGTIDEAKFLSGKYQCISETDSEILLRIFESGMQTKLEIEDVPNRIAQRLGGIKDIWASITEGAMAVALGEREDDSHRNLFLFRNSQRPLWLADLRVGLGQVFFFSSPDIWYRAMEQCTDGIKAIVKEQKLIEIPPNEVWVLHVDDDNPQIASQGQFYRFEMDVKQTGKDWDEDDFVKMQPPKTQVYVITELGQDDELKIIDTEIELVDDDDALIVLPERSWKPSFMGPKKQSSYDYEDDYDRTGVLNNRSDHESICDSIIKLAQDIKTMTSNACMEGKIAPQFYQDILDALESTRVDLKSTVHFIDN